MLKDILNLLLDLLEILEMNELSWFLLMWKELIKIK